MEKLVKLPEGQYQLIDCRSAEAYRQGHMPTSLNLVIDNFEKFMDGLLQKEDEIIFIVEAEQEADLVEIVDKLSWPAPIRSYLLWEDVKQLATNTIATIDVDQFFHLSNDHYQLLDVRHPDEITRLAPEKNLVSMPLQTFQYHFQELDQSQPIYTLCGSGNRATTAASYLNKHGYEAIVIDGGMKAVQAYLQ